MLQLLPVGEIGRQKAGLTAARDDGVYRGGAAIDITPMHHNLGTVTGELLSCCPSDAGGGPGD